MEGKDAERMPEMHIMLETKAWHVFPNDRIKIKDRKKKRETQAHAQNPIWSPYLFAPFSQFHLNALFFMLENFYYTVT